MENYPAFIIDAFTNKRFTGNPAAVCLIPQILKDEEYQKIASELNLSTTAFPVPIGTQDFQTCNQFSLRLFTPKAEIILCGHATLATSHVLFNEIGNLNNEIKLKTKSGTLLVTRDKTSLEMSFPKYELTSIKFHHCENPLHGIFSELAAPPYLFDVVKCVIPSEMIIESIVLASEAKKLIVVLDPKTTKFELEAIKPDFRKMLEYHDGSLIHGIAITLQPEIAVLQGYTDCSDECFDYVCRYFAPWVGVNEHPATGSAQCVLGPFWSIMTGKESMYVLQSYPNRGAQFRVKIRDDRVILNGSSITVMRGKITIG